MRYVVVYEILSIYEFLCHYYEISGLIECLRYLDCTYCLLTYFFKTNIQHFVSEMLGNMVFGDRAYPKGQYGKISRFNEIISRFSAQFCNWRGGGHIQFYHVKKNNNLQNWCIDMPVHRCRVDPKVMSPMW